MMSRGSSQPFQVSFTVDNGHLQAIKSQITNCNNFLLNLGVLSFKLNGHEMLNFNTCSQFNNTEKSSNVPQDSAHSSSGVSTSSLETSNFPCVASPPAKEFGGKAHLKIDALKPTPWKEESAFRVPYPPLLDDKTMDYMQRNGTRTLEKPFIYPSQQNSFVQPFVASNNSSNLQLNGITKSRQSKKRKVQNEINLPYLHASHNSYSRLTCPEINPPPQFQAKPFEQHQVYQQMPVVRPILETSRFYNYSIGVPNHQAFPSHFQSNHVSSSNYGLNLRKSGNDTPPQLSEMLKEERGTALCDDEGKDDEDKFMDAESLARLIDSDEELPFSDCLDDLDNLLDFDLPEDLNVFETSCDPSNGNLFKVFPDDYPTLDDSNHLNANRMKSKMATKVPSPSSEEKSRKWAWEEKVVFDDELNLPESNSCNKHMVDAKFPASGFPSRPVDRISPGNEQNHMGKITRFQVVSRNKEQNARCSSRSISVFTDSEKFSRPSEDASPGIPSSVLPSPCSAVSHVPGLNSSTQNCTTPSSQYNAQHNFSPSIASDSDGSPRLSTDDDRSSCGSKTASLLLSPSNWASDVSAPSEFYENSAFPRSDILTAEVGFTV